MNNKNIDKQDQDILIDKVITKQGDNGCTLSYFGAREQKCSIKIKLLGELDELNACLGVAICSCDIGMGYVRIIEEVQQKLFDIGAQLYSGNIRLHESDVEFLEKKVKEINSLLEPLVSFVVPHGESAVWHVARAVCRRTERRLWEVYFSIYNDISDVTGINMLMKGHECSACESKERVNGYVCEKWTKIIEEGYKLVGRYLNRLSDLLFCISRLGKDKNEVIWKR